MIAKLFTAIHEPAEADTPVYPIEIAENCFGLPEDVQRAKLGGLLRGIDVNVMADFALIGDLSRSHRKLTGNEKQSTLFYPGQIICDARLGRWQNQVRFFQAIFN
ncbi:hypothetical protein HNQ36_005219 [Afipia massiliensis]|uniref:Uncharacterized protein n=1 Tax=Afipia massiliensis TaxID=211460 RepID=A0A840NBS0_9BRAD|nr:hypothetical protein [Afipia massiliensis]